MGSKWILVKPKDLVMPKIKTKKAAAKRFKITASGKIKRAKANCEHILTKMSRSHKNRLKAGGYVSKGDMKNVLNCLRNG
jgi:large subunit ribosomal protein L35